MRNWVGGFVVIYRRPRNRARPARQASAAWESLLPAAAAWRPSRHSCGGRSLRSREHQISGVGQSEHRFAEPTLELLVVIELLEQLRVVPHQIDDDAAEDLVMFDPHVLLV